jgi:hypothetical protein
MLLQNKSAVKFGNNKTILLKLFALFQKSLLFYVRYRLVSNSSTYLLFNGFDIVSASIASSLATLRTVIVLRLKEAASAGLFRVDSCNKNMS